MTGQEVVDRARDVLIDSGTQPRWTDPELLRWINDGQREIARRRPDALWITEPSSKTDTTDATALADVLDINDFFRSAMIDWVLHRALNKDSEDVQSRARARDHLQLFIAGIT